MHKQKIGIYIADCKASPSHLRLFHLTQHKTCIELKKSVSNSKYIQNPFDWAIRSSHVVQKGNLHMNASSWNNIYQSQYSKRTSVQSCNYI